LQAPVIDLPPAVSAVVRVELVRRHETRRTDRGRFSESRPDELGMGGVLV
jgi:hypothetical protein